jgi:hypothetical protein
MPKQFSVINKIFNGPFRDYVPLWYTGVGYKVVQTMIINGLFPLAEFPMAFPKLWIARKLDTDWTDDSYKTKKSNMQTYIDIYSGPEYLIHFKYSHIMNVIFVTMMYGLGVPVLFLVAVLSYLVLYI